MDKAPEAFRTISEVADDLDVPQHVLRFWETRFTQIKPMKRGGGRRFYRPADVDLLQGIRKLLYGEGYTIKGVQRILREEGTAYVNGIGRGEIAARKRDARDLELDGVPRPGKATPAPRILRSAPPVGKAPPARGTRIARLDAEAEPPQPIYKLSDSQVNSLKSALVDLGQARKLLGAD